MWAEVWNTKAARADRSAKRHCCLTEERMWDFKRGDKKERKMRWTWIKHVTFRSSLWRSPNWVIPAFDICGCPIIFRLLFSARVFNCGLIPNFNTRKKESSRWFMTIFYGLIILNPSEIRLNSQVHFLYFKLKHLYSLY